MLLTHFVITSFVSATSYIFYINIFSILLIILKNLICFPKISIKFNSNFRNNNNHNNIITTDINCFLILIFRTYHVSHDQVIHL